MSLAYCRRQPVRIRIGGLGLLTVALWGCEKTFSAEDRTVQRWLLCEECVEGELDSVLALKARGERAMIEALKGPPADRLANMRRQIEAMYERIPNPGTPRQKYMDHYLDNYKALYHTRAARALHLFDTPTSHTALIEALQQHTRYREDVLRRIAESAHVILSVAAGDSQHAELDSLVRVDPAVLLQDTIAGTPVPDVMVVFKIDSGGGLITPATRLTGADGRAATRWKVGPSDSVNVLRATAAGQVIRFKALGHPRGPRIVFTAQPSNTRRLEPMTPPPQIVVQDAWGDTLTSFNQIAVVRVLPHNIQITRNITDGIATLSGLTINQAGSGLWLTVTSMGAAPRRSAPFNVEP